MLGTRQNVGRPARVETGVRNQAQFISLLSTTHTLENTKLSSKLFAELCVLCTPDSR